MTKPIQNWVLILFATFCFFMGFVAAANAHRMDMSKNQIQSAFMLPEPEVNGPALVGPRPNMAYGVGNAKKQIRARIAHRIPVADARSRWYYVFKGHIGDGWHTGTSCSEIYNRPHAYHCTMTWTRRCGIWGTCYENWRITGVLVHTTVDSWSKSRS